MKLQVAYRDMRHVEHGLNVIVSAGLIEFPAGQARAETIASFISPFYGHRNGRPPHFRVRNAYRFPDGGCGPGQDYSSYDISNMATESVWYQPLAHGDCEMFLRETRVKPSSEGLVVMAFVGMTGALPHMEIDCDSVFQFGWNGSMFVGEGKVGIDVNPEWGAPRMKEAMRGNSLMAFLRHPVWGFGKEPVSLPSAMRLDFLDRFDEYRSLDLNERRTADENARLAELLPEMKAAGMTIRDDGFRAFLAEMKSRGLLRSAGAPTTRSEAAAMELASAEIVAELHAEAPGFGA